jgi:hypothetical protein
MKHINIVRTVITVAASSFLVVQAPAEVHSKTNELIVVQPKDLPEQAQMTGNSFFLYSDNVGSTYLYVEQQQGARLTAFDVTDPSHITVVASTPITGPGAFDFVRPLGGHGELVRFRDNKSVAVLDLHKVKAPTLHTINGLAEAGGTETLGESGFLMVNEPYNYVRATPRDYQVVDISSPSEPALLATVALVKHKLVRDDTGTTFLLGSEGLTVIRRPRVEADYQSHERQTEN